MKAQASTLTGISDRESSDEARLTRFFLQYSKKISKPNTRDADDILIFIERFVTDCIAINEPGHHLIIKRSGRKDFIATKLGRVYFEQINGFLNAYNAGYFYSPNIALFFNVAQELKLLGHRFMSLGDMNDQGVTDAELFNLLIQRIQEKGRTPQHKKKVERNQTLSSKRFISLVNYVDALFEYVRSRLIIIRLDIGYTRASFQAMKPGQAQKDLRRFFGRMRSKPDLFNDLVGYIWKLERSRNGGEHFHLMLFFNNDTFRNDAYLAEKVGGHWQETVPLGSGTYFSCHRADHKAKQTKLSIGRTDYHNDTKRYYLLDSLAYLCKTTQSLLVKPKRSSRRYGRGEMPPESAVKMGRPRSVAVPPRAYLALIDKAFDHEAIKGGQSARTLSRSNSVNRPVVSGGCLV